MVDGLLPSLDPQHAADLTMQQMQMQGGQAGSTAMHPFGLVPPPPPTGGGQQPGYLQQGDLSEIYGLLATHAQDPQQVGQGYVTAMQRQQEADRRNTPMAQWLQLYGNINPYDFETQSLADFHETLMQTGDMAQAFRKLVRKEDLSTKEQGFLNEAITASFDAQTNINEMLGLADQFEAGGLQGMRAGALASVEEWFKGIGGTQDQISLMKTRFNALKNSNVVKDLPPGVASDKDIEIAMRGWPGADANPEMIAAFLRGRAKLQAFEYAFQKHKAWYLGERRSQVGQLEHWEKHKNALRTQAIMEYGGGIYDPRRADGSQMTAEEAAMHRFRGTMGGGDVVVPPTVDQATEAATKSIEEIRAQGESILERLRRENKAKSAR